MHRISALQLVHKHVTQLVLLGEYGLVFVASERERKEKRLGKHDHIGARVLGVVRERRPSKPEQLNVHETLDPTELANHVLEQDRSVLVPVRGVVGSHELVDGRVEVGMKLPGEENQRVRYAIASVVDVPKAVLVRVDERTEALERDHV